MIKRTATAVFATSILLALTACDKDDSTVVDSEDPIVVDSDNPLDGDGDGVTAADGDCDDANPDIYPGRAEDCNGIDDNCNSLADEGFGDSDADSIADCMDVEDCDGLDNDGDAGVDEGFADSDGDGVADCVGSETCDGLDNDGDGLIDEGYDVDGDGYTQCQDDCDDNEAEAYPGHNEVDGDGIDNDCDGSVDELPWSGGELVINEIMNNPQSVTDPNGEWFELYNNSGSELTIDGITIQSGSQSHVVLPGDPLVVPAGGMVVLGSNADNTTNGNVDVDYEYSGITLSNESDDLSLVADGVVIDSVTWDDGATMPDPDGGSMNLEPDVLSIGANDIPGNWCVALDPWDGRGDAGSPGTANELCSTFDHDGDGFTRDQGDCDDTSPTVYPFAPELEAGVDNDCDGDAELMPVAVATYDAASSLENCDELDLVGSGSYDPDSSGTLTYEWELTAAPSGSVATTSDLSDYTAADPTFTPDVSGSYTFSLTVNDGGTASYPVSFSVSVVAAPDNATPVAEAGTDDSYSESVTCQAISYGASYDCDDCGENEFELDGTGSSDANSDYWMTYAWSVSDADGATVSIDDSTSSTPTVTVSGVGAEYGVTTTSGVVMALAVTDCYGATSSTDTVTLSFSCTGS